MQRRLIIITGVAGVAMLLLGGLAMGLLLSPGRHVASWDSALQVYLDYKASTEGVAMRVAQAERATSPRSFDASLGGVTYGDSVTYETQVTYRQPTPTPSTPGLSLPSPGRPIPYPPKEVWCVLLSSDAPAGEGDHLVFVALHQDLYNAAWIVHEAADVDASELRTLGCNAVADVYP